MPANEEYIALPARNSTEELLEDTHLGNSRKKYTARYATSKDEYESRLILTDARPAGNNEHIIFWAAIGVACSTAFSAVLFIITLFSPPDVAVAPSRITTGVPRRPNPYLYLNRILANTTQTFPPITNFPPVALQLDNADPQRRMREDERGRPTEFGTVYPDDRHILINNQVRRIHNLRLLDMSSDHDTDINGRPIPPPRLCDGTLRAEHHYPAAGRALRSCRQTR